MSKLDVKLLAFTLLLFYSCTQQTEEAQLVGYEKGYEHYDFSLVTTPDLYLVNDSVVKLIESFSNYTEVLHYTDKYVVINEVLVPYKKNNIVYIDLQSGSKIESQVKGLDCLEYGGLLASYCVNDTGTSVVVVMGYNQKKAIYFDKKNRIAQDLKKVPECINPKVGINEMLNIKDNKDTTICHNVETKRYRNFEYKREGENYIVITQMGENYFLPIKTIQRIDEN